MKAYTVEHSAEHIAACNAACQDDPEKFRRMLLFVLSTIQQPLEMCPEITAEFETIGSESKYAFGFKGPGIDYVNENYVSLWEDAHTTLAIIDVTERSVEQLRIFLQVPGLGLVKAGFACQLFSNLVGCIDTHNVNIYEIAPTALVFNKKVKSEEIKVRKIRAYVNLCIGLGGSLNLWHCWCAYKAEIDNSCGFTVSKLHIDIISGKML